MKKLAQATMVAFSFAAASQLNLGAEAHTATINHPYTPVHIVPHVAAGSVAIGTVPRVHTIQPSRLPHLLLSGITLPKSGALQVPRIPVAGTMSTTRYHLAGPISVSGVPLSNSDAASQINAVIEGDWIAWTGGANHNLTIGMVAALLKNPKITGSQAAVLGMIADQMYSDAGTTPRTIPSYSESQVLGYILGTSNDPNAIFAGQGLSFYASSMSQIASSTLSTGKFNLYGTYLGPQLSLVQQGMLGDCFFLSALDSVLNQNPQKISNMITETATGAFVVRFPTGRIEVVRLTDGEIGAFSQAAGNGAWLAVMGMAENKALVGEPGVPGDLQRAPLGLVSDGGFPAQSLHLLTGQHYTDLGSGNLNKLSLTSIDQLLQQDLANNTPINISSQDHALSILGYNASSRTLTILNPWGVSGSFGAYEDPGIMNPYMEVQMVNGVFQLSLSNAVQDFYNITAPAGLVNAANSGSLAGARPIMSAALSNPAVIAVRLDNLMSVLPVAANSLANAPHPTTMATVSGALNLASLQAVTSAQNSNIIAALAQNVGLTDESTIVGNGQTAAAQEEAVLEASDGSTLVSNGEKVSIRTARGTVQIAPHAAALLIQVDGEVAISNLCDNHNNDVTVVVGGKAVAIPTGRTLVLTDADNTSRKNIRLAECVEGDLGTIGRFGQTNAFMGMASYAWALKNCPQFGEMMRSADPAQRRMASQLIKTGAAVITLANGE